MSLQTLLYPIVSDLLPMPVDANRVLLVGAGAPLRLPERFAGQLTVVQGFRPDYLQLSGANFSVCPEMPDERFDLACVLLGRHRGQNMRWIGEALRRLNPDGLLLVAGGKTEGVDPARKQVAQILPLEGQAAKYHGTVFWLKRPEQLPDALDLPAQQEIDIGGAKFTTAPGMFSHAHADPGSMLLIEHLPSLRGKVADFGAGWGFLAVLAANQHGKGITALDLYEADHASIEAARINVERNLPDTPARLFWHDLASEKVDGRYDFILCNPPFHAGRAADPDIGRAMIAAAAKALKPKGQLWLVANRGLPYEEVLRTLFASSGEAVREGGFKVLWGVR